MTQKMVFVDTSFWIALLCKDQNHENAHKYYQKNLKNLKLATTELVLTEFLNGVADKGSHLRKAASDAINSLQQRNDVEIVSYDNTDFDEAFSEYQKLQDKKCGLIDCASFLVMRKLDIEEVVTFDDDFRQAGFQSKP